MTLISYARFCALFTLICLLPVIGFAQSTPPNVTGSGTDGETLCDDVFGGDETVAGACAEARRDCDADCPRDYDEVGGQSYGPCYRIDQNGQEIPANGAQCGDRVFVNCSINCEPDPDGHWVTRAGKQILFDQASRFTRPVQRFGGFAR